jgi:hypothetical protein
MNVRRERLLTPLCIALLFAVNAYVARRIFFLDFSSHMESIEGPYISISRWAMDHWGDLKWFPVWFTGMPFTHVYQPGLHLTVAAFGTLLHQPAEHVYHFITALAYALGPVALFALCFGATGSRAFGLVAGLLYSLVSPVSLLVPSIAADDGGPLNPRRYWVLLKYGEGPHTTALMMAPVVLLIVHRAVTERRRRYFALAALALAAVVLTNWPGSMGLSLAILAYILSRLGQHQSLRWTTFAGVCVTAYLLVCTWVPPSVIMSVQRNAQQSDNTMLGWSQARGFIIVVALLAVMHIVFWRLGTKPWVRFFAYFALLTGSVTLGSLWFHVRLLPQPERFQLEFEMAVAGLAAYVAVDRFQRLNDRVVKSIIVTAFALFCVFQLRQYAHFTRVNTGPIDIKSTVEYRMAKAFERFSGGGRVFAPGNVALWMNMFTDVPQVGGCCDQGVPTMEHRIATYTIYTGQNAGDRDVDISLLWLRAYGADEVGVTGPNSSEFFKPYWRPGKFNGVLKELWRRGDDVIYEVPRRSHSLAHVIPMGAVIRRAPIHGLDVEPIEGYVRALEDATLPAARMTWMSQHEARVETSMSEGDVLSIQETYDSGWHATVNGAARPVTPDALGMMVVDARCSGPCVVDLVFDRTAERIIARIGLAIGALICIIALFGMPLKRRLHLTS